MILDMYHIRLRIFSFAIFLWSWGGIVTAQISFEVNDAYFQLSEKSIYPVGCTDLNGDFHDDIILTPDGRGLNIYYQTGSADYALRDINPSGFPSMITTLTSADLDQDGIDEILVSGFYNSTYVYSYHEDRYRRDTILTESVFAQGSNAVDINNDGALDFFICHDDWNNLVYLNDGAGNMEYDVSNLVAPVHESIDNSGNYGSEWIDFDDDGDIDLYIAKCRLGVTDTSDIRRKNALYVNDGNGIYTERADEYNLGSGWQSWLSQWGDIDNDGDLDALILNHDFYHELHRNEGGVFVQDTMFAGELLSDIAEQGIMQDYDNDGDLDILVCGFENYMLWNDGTGYFTKADNPFGPVDSYSGAVGDFNSDGFLDVVSTNVGQVNDRVYESVGNGNNYIKVSLNGLASNKEGVGAQVFIYGEFGVQRRDIKAGESYGIINSSTAHFGLSQNTKVDSIQVKWPSGTRDVYVPSEVNRQYIVTEGKCIEAVAKIEVEGDLNICSGDSIVLRTSINSDNLLWSNGEAAVNEITVTEAGTYSFTVTDPINSCVIQSELIYVSEFSSSPSLEIMPNREPLICKEDVLLLEIEEYDLITWSTGDTTSSISVSEEGWYSVEIDDQCLEELSDSIYISQLDPQVPIINGDSIVGEGNVALTAIGDSVHWYADIDSDAVLWTDAVYSPYLTETTSYYVSNIVQEFLPSLPLGEQTHTGPTLYSNDALNAEMKFAVNSPCTIKSIDVYSDREGNRTIELYDQSMLIKYASYSINLAADEWTTIPINFTIDNPGAYSLTTNGEMNFLNLGHQGPRLARSYEVPLNYPYKIDDLIEISSSSFGSEYYYYFYNWQIEKPAVSCESERVEVIGYVDEDLSIDDLDLNGIAVYPNPFTDILSIDNQTALSFNHFIIRDLWGRVQDRGVHGGSIDLKELSPGTYFLELSSHKDGKILRQKIVKIN